MAVNRYMRLFSYFQWIDIGQYNSTKKAYHMFPFLFLQLFTPPKKVCCVHMQSVPITINVMSSNPVQARCTRCNILR